MEETRPVTRPKLGVRTAEGPSDSQTAVDAPETAACGLNRASGRRGSGPALRLAGHPRCLRNRRACATRGGVPGCNRSFVCPGSGDANRATAEITNSAFCHVARLEQIGRLRKYSIAETATRVQGSIPASHTDTPRKARKNFHKSPDADDAVSGIEIVSHSRTLRVPERCDDGYIST